MNEVDFLSIPRLLFMTSDQPTKWTTHARGLKFAILVSRFNSEITEKLLAGAQEALKQAEAASVSVDHVPGAFELPLAAKKIAGTCDGVIALAAIVRGETPHFDFVAQAAAHGLQQVALETGKPVAFGVLTTDKSSTGSGTRRRRPREQGLRRGHDGRGDGPLQAG